MTNQESDDRLVDEVIYLALGCDGMNMARFDDILAAIPKAKEKVKDQIAFKEREIAFFEKIRLVIKEFYQDEKVDLHTLRVRSTEQGMEVDAQVKPKL